MNVFTAGVKAVGTVVGLAAGAAVVGAAAVVVVPPIAGCAMAKK